MDSDNQDPRQSLDSSLESDTSQQLNNQPPVMMPQKQAGTIKKVVASITQKTSIYLPIFFVLLVGLVVLTVIDLNRTISSQNKLATQSLSSSTLNHIASSNEVVGSSNQVLTVQSSSVFNGQVLMRNDLQVAGKLQVGGSLSLTGIVVSGNSVFDTVQVNKNFTVGGNMSVQGNTTMQGSLSTNGGATFGGALSAPQITTSSLQINGNLNLNHHITAGGPIPNQSTSAATGSGGTSSVNGSDSSGTVKINTGNGTYAGCYITVTFVTPFNSTPHVLLTPIGSSSASLSYYVNRSTNNFSVCSNNSPAPGQTYVYDYFIVD